MVESNAPVPDPVQTARDALAAANDAQREFGQALSYDALDVGLYAAAVGLTVLASGLGGAIDHQTDRLWVQIATPLIYLVGLGTLGYGVWRFRRKNRVSVSGFTPHRSRWVAIAMMVLTGVLVFASVYAGSEGLLGLVALATLAGAVMAAGFSWLWMRVYRAETAAGLRG